ncbi:uncharacterized aarF domain-containing protein kinase 1 isoform X1 [Lates japonicus]|uniref:Uncharacterized aarF domain-containing protein kinase 1 isoform X1 n=1 Tax=Lates japonicus TaxID=270547 RepID=A0AAD3R605_LATJO|nr:uncharacterized aarF domain-containing protein kinase 1 isoform X1 [Lates japonicus]
MTGGDKELVIQGAGGGLMSEEAGEWQVAGEGYGDWRAVAGECESGTEGTTETGGLEQCLAKTVVLGTPEQTQTRTPAEIRSCNQTSGLTITAVAGLLTKGDMSKVERYSRRLGAGDLYPLFACDLTARSWTAVNAGISSVPVTHSEDVEIRTNAALYLPQISDLLNRVPRQMLLLLKTNDLLRGIETTLQTRASSSSFINMSRCCIQAVARHKRSKAKSRKKRLQIKLAESLSLWRLTIYELYLWVKGSMFVQWLTDLLAFVH